MLLFQSKRLRICSKFLYVLAEIFVKLNLSIVITRFGSIIVEPSGRNKGAKNRSRCALGNRTTIFLVIIVRQSKTPWTTPTIFFEIAFHNALINAFDASRSREQATRKSPPSDVWISKS